MIMMIITITIIVTIIILSLLFNVIGGFVPSFTLGSRIWLDKAQVQVPIVIYWSNKYSQVLTPSDWILALVALI